MVSNSTVEIGLGVLVAEVRLVNGTAASFLAPSLRWSIESASLFSIVQFNKTAGSCGRVASRESRASR